MKAVIKTCLLFSLSLAATSAVALPFNDDLVNSQIKTGQVMRPKAEGVVPRGMASLRLEKKEDAVSLSNPLKGDARSLASGEQLYRINCSPCHGDITAKPWATGPVGMRLGAPDLSMAPYTERSDGSLYGTIHFGGLAIMPGYGWKLSPTEHWDLVNYVRKAQELKAAK